VTSSKLTARERRSTSSNAPAKRIRSRNGGTVSSLSQKGATDLPAGEVTASVVPAGWCGSVRVPRHRSLADAIRVPVTGTPLPGQYIVLYDTSSNVQAAAAR
jgi:predicted transcriptional regulator